VQLFKKRSGPPLDRFFYLIEDRVRPRRHHRHLWWRRRQAGKHTKVLYHRCFLGLGDAQRNCSDGPTVLGNYARKVRTEKQNR
jgi:hypothetical protein